jgi:hypothetical protein
MHGDNNSIEKAANALVELRQKRPELSEILAKTVEAIAAEANRTPRFAKALAAAFSADGEVGSSRRVGRRAPGVLNPFQVFEDTGEGGLRSQLRELDLEQLRDIVAEHGMDHDRLAMKWKTTDRVMDRIVEKVASRSSKGSAFRSPPPE